MNATKGNGRQYPTTTINGEEYPQIALDLFHRITKAHGYRKRFEGESDADYRALVADVVKAICGLPLKKLRLERAKAKNPTVRELLEAAVAHRWGYAVSTLRSNFSLRRCPGRKNFKFFQDLREFGGVEFADDGSVKDGTLGLGPDREYFDEHTPAGRDASATG